MPCACGKHRTTQGCAGARALARVPTAERQAAGRRSREIYSLRYRSQLFSQAIDRLTAHGRRITRADLLATLMEAWELGRSAARAQRNRKLRQEAA